MPSSIGNNTSSASTGSLEAAKERAKETKIQTSVDEVNNGIEKMIVDSQANQAKAWAQ